MQILENPARLKFVLVTESLKNNIAYIYNLFTNVTHFETQKQYELVLKTGSIHLKILILSDISFHFSQRRGTTLIGLSRGGIAGEKCQRFYPWRLRRNSGT